MVLFTHTVVGVAAAQMFPQYPISAFALGFVSHYAIDFIPHWNYEPPIMAKSGEEEKERSWAKTFLFTGLDFLLGVVMASLLFGYFIQNFPLSFALAAIGSVLPDALIGLGVYRPSKFLHWINSIHAKHRHIKNLPWGIIGQILLILAAVILAKYFI